MKAHQSADEPKFFEAERKNRLFSCNESSGDDRTKARDFSTSRM
jgi:hypothetical protein